MEWIMDPEILLEYLRFSVIYARLAGVRYDWVWQTIVFEMQWIVSIETMIEIF